MNDKTISIIVPVYNTEKYLSKCIESLQKQTFRNLEILLINDGSRDQSPQICDRYAAGDQRIVVVHKENGGLMSAWMEGVHRSTGEYLAFLDSDDWVEPTMLEEMQAALTGADDEIICGNYLLDREGTSTPCSHPLPPGIYQGKKLEQEVKPYLLGNEQRIISMSRCMKLISRKLIENNIHYCDPRITMGEDVNILFPVLLDASRIVILEGAWHYHYVFLQSSMVHRYDPGLARNIEWLFAAVQQVITDKISVDKISEKQAFYLERARQEYLYLWLLVIRNEVRGPGTGCVKRVKECRDTVREILKSTVITPRDPANRLCFLALRYPAAAVVWLLRMAVKVYAKR